MRQQSLLYTANFDIYLATKSFPLSIKYIGFKATELWILTFWIV